MSLLELSGRVSSGAVDIDFRKAAAAVGRFLLRLLVFLIAMVPYAVAWSITMFVRIVISSFREGARAANAQLGAGS